jgi:hypothetical protein
MTIEDVLNCRKSESDKLKRWKELNIGGNFDADKFISIVREYV